MGKSETVFRFAVANTSGKCSSIWRVWSHKNDIYVSFGKLGGKYKASFHKDGNNFLSITEEERRNITDPKWKGVSRLRDTWKIEFNKRINRLVEIWIPPLGLSQPLIEQNKSTHWIPPAREGFLTSVCIFRALAPPSTTIKYLKDTNSEELLYNYCLNDESSVVIFTKEHKQPENLENFIKVRDQYINSPNYDELSHGSEDSITKIDQLHRTVIWHTDEFGNKLWIDTKTPQQINNTGE